jgi:pimeloyl-ACP methyl ester carboxylesterase
MSTRELAIAGVSLTLAEEGEGQPVLVLHGGGGPFTVAGIAQHLATTHRVLTPTHPGWNGTPRPDWLDSVDELALFYLRLLAQRGLRDVTVIGSSMGGWVAAQMAVRDIGGLVGRIVLIDSAGIFVPEHPVVDFAALSPREQAEHSWHNPDRFFVDPTTLPPERLAMMRGNMATMAKIAAGMHDPKLQRRLGELMLPALVIWGESDRVFTPGYGAALTAAIPGARFEIVREAGHLPQMEQPEATLALIDGFAG